MSLQPKVSTLLLQNVPLLAQLTEDQCARLTSVVHRRNWGRGAIVVGAGETADALFVILTGRVQVVMRDDHGKEVILAILGPGDHFGEMALIDEQRRSATVVVREPCEAVVLMRADFVRCLQQSFDMTMAVAKGLVKRLRDADNRIASLALLDVYGRVAKVLLDMSEDKENPDIVEGRLSRQDIAKMVGASREMVSRVMRDLEMRGFVQMRGDAIVLRNRIALLDCEPVEHHTVSLKN
jgi:CRP/FNR family transcriptional regulator, cyclic AMP receptor protein